MCYVACSFRAHTNVMFCTIADGINKETNYRACVCVCIASPPATMHTFMMMHWQATLLVMLTTYGSPKVAITLISVLHMTYGSAVISCDINVAPNDFLNLQFDRCPTLALCPITSFFFDRIGIIFLPVRKRSTGRTAPLLLQRILCFFLPPPPSGWMVSWRWPQEGWGREEKQSC